MIEFTTLVFMPAGYRIRMCWTPGRGLIDNRWTEHEGWFMERQVRSLGERHWFHPGTVMVSAGRAPFVMEGGIDTLSATSFTMPVTAIMPGLSLSDQLMLEAMARRIVEPSLQKIEYGRLYRREFSL